MNMAWKPKRKRPGFQRPVVHASNTPKGDSKDKAIAPAKNVSRMAMENGLGSQR